MNYKRIILLGLIVLVIGGLVAGGQTAVAYPTQPTIALGEPGLAFRYVEEFGTVETPYIADGSHLNDPSSVTVDNFGNIWVSEWSGMRTSKFNSSGVYQFSLGKAGVDGDEGILGPVGDTAVDSSGNIWAAEVEDHRVVKFNNVGEYQLELGQNGESGIDNNHFDRPYSLAFDSSGNLYVSDSNNHRIQIFDSSGVHTATLGVTGVSGEDSAYFYNPRHLYIDSADTLYVADSGNHRVQIFNVSNPLAISYVATLGVTGVSGSDDAHFYWPMGVAADSGKIYVVDINNQRVQIFNAITYAYLATIGTGAEGAGNNEFAWPSNVAVDGSGNIYVSEYGNHRVQKFNSSYAYVSTMGVTGIPYLTSANYYNLPHHIAATSDGGFVVVEERGHRLIKSDGNGNQLWTVGEAGIGGSDTAHLHNPLGVAEAPNGNIYVADAWNNRVQIFGANGNYLDSFGSYGSGNDQFSWPTDIAFDANGNIYVVDTNNHRIQVYGSNLNYLATIGVTDESGSDNIHLNAPRSVAIDSIGTMYIADGDNDRVQVFNSNYVYQRTIGLSASGCNDSFDRFCGPHDLAVDAQNRLYVADTWNNRVQVYDSAGAYLTTISGRWGGQLGEIRGTQGIAIDDNGNVYISDSYNHRIYKYAPGVPGWKQVNLNGFGNRQNWGAWALGAFNDVLYVSTSNSDTGAEVYRYVSGTWEQVVSGGFGDSTNVAVDWFAEFNGSLYAATWNDGGGGGQIWRSATGNSSSWTKVVDAGFGDAVNSEVMSLAAFNGSLYAGTWSSDTNTHGAEIWRSASGDSGSWTRVLSDAVVGHSNTTAILSMELFNNALYAATYNNVDGGQIWRTSNGTTWTQANVNGFGNINNADVISLEVFNGQLYAGTYNGTSGAEIWRATNGADWTQVVGAGFGSVDNKMLSSIVAFDGSLYAVVGNFATGAEVWRSTSGDSGSWHKVIGNGFGSGTTARTNWDNGTAVVNNQLYVSTNTSEWTNGGGRVWQMQRQVFLPAVIR